MPTQKITDQFLSKTAKNKTPNIYRDPELKGFAVRLSPEGKLTFIVEKKIKGTQDAPRISIGTYPAYKAGKAREEAIAIIQLCEKGIDPRKHKKEQAEIKRKQDAKQQALSKSFEDIFTSFIASKDHLKKKTLYDYGNTVRLYCKDWMKRPIREITHQDALNKYNEVKKKAGAKQKAAGFIDAGRGQANKLMRCLGSVFSYAESFRVSGERLIQENPCKIFKEQKIKLSSKRRERVLHHTEIEELFNELSKQDWLEEWAKANTKGDRSYIYFRKIIKEEHNKGYVVPAVRDYINLLLFAGLRRDEALNLKWADVNFDDGFFTVKDTKNHKDHSVPMTATIRKTLESRRISVDSDCIWVFPAVRLKNKPLAEPKHQLKVLCDEIGFKFTSHDLRRTFATCGHQYGLDDRSIGRALNHTIKGVTASYIVPSVETIRPIFEKIEEQILSNAFHSPVFSKLSADKQTNILKFEREIDDHIKSEKKTKKNVTRHNSFAKH